MFERFTERARRVVVLAQEEARSLNHDYIGTEHLLLGLVREADGIAGRALSAADVRLGPVRARVAELVSPGPKPPRGHVPFSPRAKEALEQSLKEALHLGHNYIGTEHLLLALAAQKKGAHAEVFRSLNLAPERIRELLTAMLGDDGAAQSPEDLIAEGPGRSATGTLIDKDAFGSWLEQSLERAREVFDRSTLDALLAAPEEADLVGSAHVGTEHVLLAVIRPADGIPARVLRELDVSTDAIISESARRAGMSTRTTGKLLVSDGIGQVLAAATFEAVRRGSAHVELADLFLAIIESGAGIGSAVLHQLGAPRAELRVITRKLIADADG